MIATLQRIIHLLTQVELRRAFLVFLGIFAGGFVEILGLAAVIPVVSLVVNPDAISTYPVLQQVFVASSKWGIESHKHFLLLLCSFMVVAFLFKAAFGLLIGWVQARFSFAIAYRLSDQMWDYHFSNSLEKMRTVNSGKIIAEINGWPIQFASTFIIGSLLIISELTVISIISIGLLIYNHVVFFAVAFLLVLGTTIIRELTRTRLSSYSSTRKILEPQSNTLITSAVRGFVEIITFRAKDTMKRTYLRDRREIFRILSKVSVLNVAPARLYEVLAVIAIAFSIMLSLIQTTPHEGLLELLTFMAVSAYRVMPSMSRVNGAIMQMRSQMHVLDAMESGNSHDLRIDPLGIEENNSINPAGIELKEVSLSYDGDHSHVISKLSYRFEPGRIYAIVGPSGAGKSTLLNAIIGLHFPSEGKIVAHFDFAKPLSIECKRSSAQWLEQVAFIGQQPFLFQGTLEDNLTFRRPNFNLNESETLSLMRRLRLTQLVEKGGLQFEISEGGGNLSGGQQQRIALMRALLFHKPVLILDEATSALDQDLRDVVWQILKDCVRNGRTIILVTHDKALAERCDEVLSLEKDLTLSK